MSRSSAPPESKLKRTSRTMGRTGSTSGVPNCPSPKKRPGVPSHFLKRNSQSRETAHEPRCLGLFDDSVVCAKRAGAGAEEESVRKIRLRHNGLGRSGPHRAARDRIQNVFEQDDPRRCKLSRLSAARL